MMRLMKICFVCCLFVQFAFLGCARAAVSEAYMEYMSAWASMAVYSDKFGLLARDMMNEYGWQAHFEMQQTNLSDAKMLLAKKQIDGIDIYLAAISGTSSAKDIKTDLRTGSAVFGGSSPQQFAEVMADEELSDTKPLVHSGFAQYVQDGFFVRKYIEENDLTLGEVLADRLKKNPRSKLYITGHSLGGAAAEILAARFLDMGVDSSQLCVISFGAPAVGNQTFVDKYEPRLNLTRITMDGDPVKNLAQIANDRFVQFKTETKWTLPDSESDKFAHGMLLYFDRAMCRYYEQSSQIKSDSSSNIDVSFDFPPELSDTEHYIKAALEEYDLLNPHCKEDEHVVYRFTAELLKDESSGRRYYIDAAKYVYGADGVLLHGGSAGTDTKEMTVVQAALYAAHQSGR